jgi:hypothetical protein
LVDRLETGRLPVVEASSKFYLWHGARAKISDARICSYPSVGVANEENRPTERLLDGRKVKESVNEEDRLDQHGSNGLCK